MNIESFHNEKIKYLTRLVSDNRFRKKENVFVVEGQQENKMAGENSFVAKEFYICKDLFHHRHPDAKINFVNSRIYEKIAYRGSSEGIIGIYEIKENNLQSYLPEENASVIIVEGIEKPGNLGAIIRSCEAFGIDALIVANPKTDFFNPNVIRSSVGCLFGMKLFKTDNDTLFEFLKNHQFNIFTTLMDESAEDLYKKKLNEKTAILFGTEHSGLTDFWHKKGENTLIPMNGSIDSLNLSNAVAVCCYEILRQKLTQKKPLL